MRAAGLLVTGAVAVHELRYAVGGSAADPGAGHGYLPVAGLLSTVLLGIACAQLAAVVERARRTGGSRAAGAPERVGFLRAWLVAALALMLIFAAQELLESLLAGGRAGDLSSLVADGGWSAAPISTVVGALLALALVGARSAVAAAARAGRHLAPRRPRPRRLEPARGHRPLGSPLARHLAGRAPPVVLR